MKIGEIKTDPEIREHVKERLRAYATAYVAVAKRKAAAAKKKEAIDRELAEDNAADTATMTMISTELDQAAKVYRAALFPGKARKFDADTATLALQKKTEVIITDAEEVVAFATLRGRTDLVKTTTAPQKLAVKACLQAGEAIPGASLLEAENINIKIRDDLVAEPEAEG